MILLGGTNKFMDCFFVLVLIEKKGLSYWPKTIAFILRT